ncbi:MAG: RNA 2'-phosphotransferase [Bacteroidia bacterium]|nr:RNA 2'-phosphotransferase [Bacteroidia bacterium]
MNQKKIIQRSKFLSLVLRHKPEKIGIQLDENGWVKVNHLLKALSEKKQPLSIEELEEVVEKNNKKRFAFNEDKSLIRASQGHSVDIKLGYEAIAPPETLFHGTATRFLESIREKGLIKGNRHHVHLSAELDTASKVGARHGKLVVLKVRSADMAKEGFEFYRSENGVWLTDHVPVEFLIFPELII